MIKRLVQCIAAAAFLVSALEVRAAESGEYDVVVYGGTPGGIAAAVAAARQGDGISVILLEPKRHIGGMNTSGLVNSEVHNMKRSTIIGISEEFYQRMGRIYGKEEEHYFESHAAERAFTEMIEEAGVPVHFGARVKSVHKVGARIEALEMTDGTRFEGNMFIDATYEGDLMARAGVSYTWGRESRDTYGESLAGVRLGDTVHKAAPFGAEGNLLPGVNARIGELTAGEGDRKVLCYNFRLEIVQSEDRVPFPKPDNYDPSRYQLLANYLREHPESRIGTFLAMYPRPHNGKVEVNNNQSAIISIGHMGGQFEYPDADYETQDRIFQDHVDYTQGFLYFLGHDPAVPKPLRDEANRWGLAPGEFADNNHWPYYLYIREARRMTGEYVMTERDVTVDRAKPDFIGQGSHRIDAHHVQRVAVDENHFTNEGRIWIEGKIYDIPYRSIVPKAEECENLLVPVCASFSHVAFMTFRLEPTWMVAGEAAGTAAVAAIEEGAPVQSIDIAALQARLPVSAGRVEAE